MKISFTDWGGNLSASVTINSGLRSEKTLQAKGGCRKDPRVDLSGN